MALTPVYAALRSHTPGRRGGRSPIDLDNRYEGQWAPLVSRADWFAVQRRLLRSPQRKITSPGRAKHLLSLIGRCGVCLGTLNVAYLARPDVIDTLRTGDHELSAVRDQLAVVRVRHEQFADAVAAGTVSVATLVRAEPPCSPRSRNWKPVRWN